MITHDARRSLSRGNNPVPSPWLATATNSGLIWTTVPLLRQRIATALCSAHLPDLEPKSLQASDC
jgi:hypothetical protein